MVTKGGNEDFLVNDFFYYKVNIFVSLAAVKCAQLIPFLLPMPQSVQCVMRSQNMLVCYLK